MITSAANPRLKLIRRLGSAAQRKRLGLFVVEGEDLVDAGVAAGLEPVDVLVAGSDVTAELLADVSDRPHPPRVVAVFRRDGLPGGSRSVCLALHQVSDPGNVGTLIRTADAHDAALALSAGCGDPISPKALRASAGAIFRVPLIEHEDAPRPWVALVAEGGTPLAEADLSESVTFVLGAERDGVPDELLARCDARVTIPTAPHSESLNVAVAGALALYEHRRRHD